MANNPFFADGPLESELNTYDALLNGGKLEVFSGTQPTDANTAIGAQVLLVTITFGATAFASATASGTAPSRVVSAAANAMTSGNAVASGTAAWFRCFKSDGTTVMFDGSVGTSGCDLNLSSVSITSGQPVSISSFTITQPE